MKRRLITILSLVVVIALSLGILAACQKGLSTEQLDTLFNKFTTLHKNDPKESPASYWVDGDVFYTDDDGQEVSVKVKWTIEGTNLVTVGTEPNVMGKYQVIIPEGDQAEAVDYKLVGTLVDENGNAYKNKDGAEYKLEISKTIPAGKTYKLAIRQLALGKVLYAKAAVKSDYYLDTAESAAAGADFHTEAVDGGHKIYTMIGSTKSYLGAKVSGTYTNICLGGIVGEMNAATYQGSVWTISADGSEIKTALGDKTVYLGTYGNNASFGVSTTKTYPAFLVEAGAEIKSIVQVKVSAQSQNCTVAFTSHTADKDNIVAVEADTVVKFTVTPATGYEVVSVKNGINVLKATDGTYSVTADKSISLVVETRLIGSNGAKSPVEGVCANQELPVGWTYISNNPEKYPNPSFYSTNGKAGLKVQYENQGIESPVLDGATDEITVKVNIYALNAGNTPKEANGQHFFKVVALDANGQEVTTGYIDTFNTNYNNEVVLNVGESIVKKIQVLLVEQPAVSGKAQNINLGGVKISWGEPTATIGETGYKTLEAAVEAAKANDTIVLQKNVVVTTNIVVDKKITLDLNGKTISNTADIWNDTNKVWSLISVRENGELTIKGNGKLDAKKDDGFAVDVRDGGKLTIENGEFVGNLHSVYVLNGSAEIKGGKFDLKQLDEKKIAAGGNGYEFTLNLHDASGAAGTATITVTGGSFVNFDPSHSKSENPEKNFVAKGCTVTPATAEGKTVYTVGKDNIMEVVLTTENLKLAEKAYSTKDPTEITIDDFDLAFIGLGNYGDGIQWRYNNKDTGTSTIYNTASAGHIVSIKFVPNAKQGNTTKENHLKVEYGATDELGESKIVTLTSDEVVITFDDGTDCQYFKISNNNNGAVYVDSIVITIEIDAETSAE